MARGIITWTNPNPDADGIRIYRSLEPFGKESLPAVHATIAGDADGYEDPDVMADQIYYYLFEQFKGSETYFTRQHYLLTYRDGQASAFLGEVSASELINGFDLAARIGLTVGTAQHDDEPWLKFIHQGKVLYIAKKPYRHNLSWDAIHAQGAVFGTGVSVVEINGATYRCRLLTGANEDPTTAAAGTNPAGTEDSEWNRLLYPVHVDDPEGRAWAQYTDADLHTRSTHGNGAYSWCQETNATNAAQRVFRGSSGVLDFSFTSSSNSSTLYGWRPVLELI